MEISRRAFLNATPLALTPLLPGCGDEDGPIGAGAVFQHGVASGDPLGDAVVIWTRLSVEDGASEPVAVEWTVAIDMQLASSVAQGVTHTDESVDHTVKVDVVGLSPGTTYFYRFTALGQGSPIGRTRTAHEGATDRLRFALASCSFYSWGFFNAYAAIARRADLDAVLHLGDYLYEYGDGDVVVRGQNFGAAPPLGRTPDPPTETLTLEDYRRRHALYKRDPDLQEAHRQHPFIAIWDDHDVANDAWRNGAENHQPETEGDFSERKAAALRAYFEWMPVRAVAQEGEGLIYRSFRFGDLVDLIMLDTRLIGRDQQVADPCDAASIDNPERQLLGAAQESWFFDELSGSQARGARWRLVGQQVMMAQFVNVLEPGNCPFNPDQWDGYPAARARVLSTLAENAIGNVVVLTGDFHSSWANDLTLDPFDAATYDPSSGTGSVAVEIVTPSVTSPLPGVSDNPVVAAQLAGVLRATHPHVKYIDFVRHGYTLLDVTPERVLAEWYHVATIAERRADEELAVALEVVSGENHLTPASGASEPRADAAPLAPAVGG
jgi:alkaline phosphatase D